MQLWNGVVMYAPHTPDQYAIPGMQHCIFRLMQEHGDTQAWNLYWLSKPETDALLLHRNTWFRHYESLSSVQTEAFYQALDTPVLNRLTLATLVAQPPREAIRLIQSAHLEHCRFYELAGGEAWRQMILGRLFIAARRSGETMSSANTEAEVLRVDFINHRFTRHAGSGTNG